MKLKLTYGLLVTAILAFGAAAWAASSTTDVRKANTGAAFGSGSAVQRVVYKKVLDFTETASSSTNGVGTLETTGNAGDSIILADMPAGFKATNVFWWPETAETTGTWAVKLGSTTLVSAVNAKTTAGTAQVCTVVDLAPLSAEATLNIGPAVLQHCHASSGTLEIVGIVVP